MSNACDTWPVLPSSGFLLPAVAAFAAICSAAQLWPHDLDPIAMPLSLTSPAPGAVMCAAAWPRPFLRPPALLYLSSR